MLIAWLVFIQFYQNRSQREALRASTDAVLSEPQGHGGGYKL